MGARIMALIVGLASLTAGAAVPSTTTAPAVRAIFRQTPDQATVITATFLGGKGHEWFVGGGWQADGSILLVGNVLGPALDLGAAVQVIGTDAAPPAPAEAPKVELGDRGRPFPLWNLPGATGFVARCEPDLKKVISVHRLPWTSGTITMAAVDKAGAVYVAGVATENTAKLGGRHSTTRIAAADPKAPCDRTFLAKLAPDLARCEWIIVLEGPSNPPQVRVLNDGTIWFAAQDVRRLDASGKVLWVAPTLAGRTRALSPVDGLSARASNRGNWSTGREPWKCPGIRISRPDGTDLYHLYEWDGRYVGLDNHRSVADTTVMMLTYDYDGNLLLATWSDGGNTVMRYGSHDIRRTNNLPGLGFGRGMTGYNVVKLEGRDYYAVARTLWQAEANGIPGGLMRMQTLVPLPDGNILISGSGGPRGINQTAASLLPDAPPQGNFVTVLSGNLTMPRFSTLVGGAGEIDMGNSIEWGAACGQAQGRSRVLLVSGAKKESEPVVHAPVALATPTRNAMQGEFGGGATDGYAILLDMPPVDPAVAMAMAPVKYERLGVEARAVPKRREPLTPPEGTVYYFAGDYPRHVTADAEFRDARDTAILYEPCAGWKAASEPLVRGGVSVWVRPLRPVFGPGEALEFDLIFTNTTGAPVRLPFVLWELRLEGWTCQRANNEDPLTAVTLEPRSSHALKARLPVGSHQFTQAGGKPVTRLPLGVYKAAIAFDALVTSAVEFRIAPYWPNFMYGKSVAGEMKWQGGRLVGSATVACPTWVQVQGDQSRRVLGELLAGKEPQDFPPVRFTLGDLGPMKTLESKTTDAKGKEMLRSVQYVEGKGRLEFNGRTLDVATRSILNFSAAMPDNGKPGVGIETFLTVKGRDLGLSRLADDEIDLRIGMRGTLEKSEPPKAPTRN